MTIRDEESIAHLDVEAVPVADDYGMGIDNNVPFASAVTAVELEEPATPIGAPYSFGMSATSHVNRTSGQTQRAAPMIQQQQHIVAQPPPIQQYQQQHSGNHQHARRNNRNNQGCCNNPTCCCVTAWILGSLCVFVVLPSVIILIFGVGHVATEIDLYDDVFSTWNDQPNGFGTLSPSGFGTLSPNGNWTLSPNGIGTIFPSPNGIGTLFPSQSPQ